MCNAFNVPRRGVNRCQGGAWGSGARSTLRWTAPPPPELNKERSNIPPIFFVGGSDLGKLAGKHSTRKEKLKRKNRHTLHNLNHTTREMTGWEEGREGREGGREGGRLSWAAVWAVLCCVVL